jgi:hypothetical protein
MDDLSEQQTIKHASLSTLTKQNKPQKLLSQRSNRIMPTTMKKQSSFGIADSEQDASSYPGEVDFDDLIRSKFIDRSKDKPAGQPTKEEGPRMEECSPSWFNAPNQRFDSDAQPEESS